MRCMTRRAAFGLDRRVLERKRSLLVYVTLEASGIRARRQTGLLRFESAVRVVTVAATHRAFQNFVMERHAELRLNFAVTTRAQLRIVRLQHANGRKSRLLGVRSRWQQVRTRRVAADLVSMGRVTIDAANVVAPVLAAAEVVALFLAGVTRKTSLGDLFRSLTSEGDDLRLVAAAVDVRFARTVTRFAAGRFVFPATQLRQRRVGRVRVRLEGVFVTGLAGLAADVVTGCRLVVITRKADRLRTPRSR